MKILLLLTVLMQSIPRISSGRTVAFLLRSSGRRTVSLHTKFLVGSLPSSGSNGRKKDHFHYPTVRTATSSANEFFADLEDFKSLGIQSSVLLSRIQRLGLERPTAVQAAAYADISAGVGNVTVGAETGSGKTYAYLLPIFDDILKRKEEANGKTVADYDYARALILVPNKELVQQIIRMAMPLSGGKKSLVYGTSSIDPSIMNGQDVEVAENEMVRLAIMPAGLNEPTDFPPFRHSIGLGGKDPPVDIVITTPASFGPLGLKPKHIDIFADIQTLVIDEADMLLDGGYIRQLENVLMGFRRADRLSDEFDARKTQHVFVAATLPDFGLRSVDAYLQKKFPNARRVTLSGMHNARHYGLREPTKWIKEENKKDRMEQLVEMLNAPADQGGLKGEKIMVFLNSVDDVEGACKALLRAGKNALPYHAKLSLSERTSTLSKFRNYDATLGEQDDTVPILICTDLAARGLDVPNVNAVVQLQFAGNVVAHLHRMGRCGRAGQRTGRGIIFFADNEAELVKVVKEAEEQQERMVLEKNVDFDDAEDDSGTVKKAFSRRRGFTKKLKKLKKEETSNND